MDDGDLDEWFMTEILPLEATIVSFLHCNWGKEADIDDLRQETYTRIYEAAGHYRPRCARTFMLQIVQGLLAEKQRRDKVVSIDAFVELDDLELESVDETPEKIAAIHQEAERLQEALDKLSARCRAVVILRKVYGVAQRDVARELGIEENTVAQHLAKGVRILAQSVGDRRGHVISRAKRYLSRARLG